MFQSSAAPKSGCNMGLPVKGRTPVGFNPQPPRRAAATRTGESRTGGTKCFNPQPPRRAAATCKSQSPISASSAVSILSRPEERLQLNDIVQVSQNLKVSILSRPEERLQRTGDRARRPRAGFQSSAAPKSGCNLRLDFPYNPAQNVSILSRPEERLQHNP